MMVINRYTTGLSLIRVMSISEKNFKKLQRFFTILVFTTYDLKCEMILGDEGSLIFRSMWEMVMKMRGWRL